MYKKRLLISLTTISSVAAVAILSTGAFFSDTETSVGNTLVAGELDLKIDNTSWYNGVLQPKLSWELKDLEDELFFDFQDLKPGDWEEDTASLHVKNQAWVCSEVTLTESADNGITEPEAEDGDVADGQWAGELDEELQFIFWPDDGDNVLEDDEEIILSGGPDELPQDPGVPVSFPIADSNGNIFGGDGPLEADVTHYIGKAFCYGDLTLDPVAQGDNSPADDPGFDCDGSLVSNVSQTDSVKGDVKFLAVQARNNEDFQCLPSASPKPSVKPSPSPLACGKADVMLVLDRSGSVNSTELSQLKTAAKDFVDALGLTDPGVHAGQSSFATTGTLDHHLTFNSISLKAAIDALVSSGFTNLKEGIDLAKLELDNPGDGHDRGDLDSPDKMLIITDGNPNRPLPSSTADDVAKTAADAARAAGSEIFVVGVGSDVNETYLKTIADDDSHYFSVADYSGLQTTLANLDLCDED